MMKGHESQRGDWLSPA